MNSESAELPETFTNPTLGMPPLEPVRPVQLYEQVAERIGEQIRAGLWKPGDRLPPERQLARELAVSRPSLREALAALQVSGLLSTRPGSGSFVSDDALRIARDQRKLTTADSEYPGISPTSLLEVRQPLEAAIASAAARKHIGDPYAETLLGRMDQNLDPSDPEQRAAWSETDRLFHRQIAVMAGNAIFMQFSEVVADAMDQPLWRRLRDDAISRPGRNESYAAEHREIYDSILKGDTEASSFFASGHIQHVRRDMSLE